MNITSKKPELRYLGEKLAGFDAVIPRIAASHTFYGLAVLRQFEMMGVYPLNEIGRHRPLARQAALAADPRARRHRPAGHRLRQRHHAHQRRARDRRRRAGGDEAARGHARHRRGAGGDARSRRKSVIEAFHGADIAILVQEFIKEAEGSDMRVFVVGGRVVAAMERPAPRAISAPTSIAAARRRRRRSRRRERQAALKAAKSMGLNVAGVDLLRSKHGPVVMEVNSSPGLEGIEKATGADIAPGPSSTSSRRTPSPARPARGARAETQGLPHRRRGDRARRTAHRQSPGQRPLQPHADALPVHVHPRRTPGPSAVRLRAPSMATRSSASKWCGGWCSPAPREGIAGTLLAVPIVNAFGFISQSRYLPDRRDLNRSFPGSDRGSLASVLADLFMREVVSACAIRHRHAFRRAAPHQLAADPHRARRAGAPGSRAKPSGRR